MNYSSLGLAALGGTVASFAFGFLVFWLVPALINEAPQVPGRIPTQGRNDGCYANWIGRNFHSDPGCRHNFRNDTSGRIGHYEGARFGVLIGIFVVCASVLHNYVNLNIGLKLALGQAVAYFVQWTIIGIVIGLIYKPLATP